MAEILHARVSHTIIIRAKVFFPTTYLLAKVHPLQTDRWTDVRQPCQ